MVRKNIMMNTRRGFIGGTLATGMFSALNAATEKMGSRSASGDVWGGWKSGEFQVHFIYTGVAESMFIIFPDSTTMLLDCGDHAAVTRLDLAVPVMPNSGRLAGDWIARYVRRVNPNGDQVDYMVTSHFHIDHTGTPCWQSRRVLKDGDERTGCYRSGFGLAIEHLHFRKAVDRGWPNYDDPVPFVDSDWKPLEHMKRIYAYLVKRDGMEIEKFRLGATDQFVPLHNQAMANGFLVRNLCANGRIAYPDGHVHDVCSENNVYESLGRLNFNGSGRIDHGYLENMMSIGMVFSYGKFRFYTAGDFSGPPEFPEVEKAIGKATGKVDVAKINHHGHHSMPPELVGDFQARVYVACVWDQLHVTDDTMTHLSDTSLYSGERTVFPGIMAAERRLVEGDRQWMRNVPKAVYEGAHIVLSVPPGGETYRVTCLTAADESMRIKAQFEYRTHDK